MNVKIPVIQSIIVATAVLHNIALKFTEPTPPVSSELDNLIRMEESRIIYRMLEINRFIKDNF